MKNILKVCTTDGLTTLCLIDGTNVKWAAPVPLIIYSELCALSRHEHILYDAMDTQEETNVKDAQTMVTILKKDRSGKPVYRFQKIRVRYWKTGGRYTFIINLPPGFPLSLKEAEELRETLREHTRFNGPGVLITPPELEEVKEETDEPNADSDEEDFCDGFIGKEGAKSDECEDCVLFAECFPEETEKVKDSE